MSTPKPKSKNFAVIALVLFAVFVLVLGYFISLNSADHGESVEEPAESEPQPMQNRSSSEYENVPSDPAMIAPELHAQWDSATEKYGYVDTAGSWVIEPRFSSASEFSENGFANVQTDPESRVYIIDALGNWVIGPLEEMPNPDAKESTYL